jgi:hypothetical protein
MSKGFKKIKLLLFVRTLIYTPTLMPHLNASLKKRREAGENNSTIEPFPSF